MKKKKSNNSDDYNFDIIIWCKILLVDDTNNMCSIILDIFDRQISVLSVIY